MKGIISAIAVIFWLSLSGQGRTDEFINTQCEYFTDGKGKTFGIKMKYNVPCSWDSVVDTRPFLIKSHAYKIADSGILASGVIITKMPNKATVQDKQNIFKDSWAKSILKAGEMISVKKVRIDNYDWAEYVFIASVNAPQGEVHEFATAYYTLFEDKGIMVMYKAMSTDLGIGALLFIDYLELFRTLASGISVYNFWDIK